MVDDPADNVVTVNVPVVAPLATVTFAGTVAAAVLLLVKDTTAPPEGAALVSVTVPWTAAPATTEIGLSVMPASVAAVGVVGVDFDVQPPATIVSATKTAAARLGRCHANEPRVRSTPTSLRKKYRAIATTTVGDRARWSGQTSGA